MAAARSEERDVAMIQRRYEAWQAGDLEGALAHVGPAMEWIEPPDTPDGQTWRGREGVLAAMAEWTEPFDEFRFEVIDASSIGGGVLMGLVQRGRGKGSGVEVESEVWHLWTLHDGVASRLQMFRSKPDALAAAESTSRPAGAA